MKNTSKLRDVIFHLFSLVELFLSASYVFTELQYDKYFLSHISPTSRVDLSPAAGTKRSSCIDRNAKWLGDGKGCMFQKCKGTENSSSSTGHKVAITQMRSFMVSQPFYC